jgi:DNA-binding CsgD family transcriptional regulator
MPNTASYDPSPALDVIATIEKELARLKGLVQPQGSNLNPKDPRNRSADGKLTPRGVETCYLLMDLGKSNYAVAEALGISFGAAKHRRGTYERAGGPNRQKMPLD